MIKHFPLVTGISLGILLMLSSCFASKTGSLECPKDLTNKYKKIAVHKRNKNKSSIALNRLTRKKHPIVSLNGMSGMDKGKDNVVSNLYPVHNSIMVPYLECVNGLSKIDYSKGLIASVDETVIPLRRNYATALSINKASTIEQPEDIIITPPAGCDTIILKSGSKIICTVNEIGQNAISYRKCDDSKGAVISVLKSEVSEIRGSNGKKVFITSSYVTTSGLENVGRKIEKLGLAGFILSLIGLISFAGFIYLSSGALFYLVFLLGLLGIIFGGISLHRIKIHPRIYKGKLFAILSLVMGIIDIVFLCLAIIIAAIIIIAFW